MPLDALVIVLAAATLHAFWNLVIARARDTQAVTALALTIGVAAALPFAISRWDVRPEAWPFIALSAALESIYIGLLTAAYQRAEMSLVYPIARGAAPVIVLLISVLALNSPASLAQVGGVALVALGVVLVGGMRGAARGSDVALALAVAVAIASYTLVDQQGVAFADPVTYVTLILIPAALLSVAVVTLRGGPGRIRQALSPSTVVGGISSVAAYGLVLMALALAPAASVAATREVSVVIGTGLAAFVLHERVGLARLVGAVVVVAGVALIVTG